MWVDSHCHVGTKDFAEDREEVLARAAQAGVDTLIAIGAGYGVLENQETIQLAERCEQIFATVGVHPHDAKHLDDAGRKQLRAWLAHPRVVAVGECGLDYHYLHSPRELQREVFAEHVALARELDLPVSIHVRGDDDTAYRELLDIWQSEGRGELEGVLHCYTYNLDFAQQGIAANLYVSFSGVLTFKKDRGLRGVAEALPLERLLVETDAPFLAPEGKRGKRNEPAWVVAVGEALAALKHRPVVDVARITRENTFRLFRLDTKTRTAAQSRSLA